MEDADAGDGGEEDDGAGEAVLEHGAGAGGGDELVVKGGKLFCLGG